LFEKEGASARAYGMLNRVVSQAPHWMDARMDLYRVAKKLGQTAEGERLASESLQVLAAAWREPTSLSWRASEYRPTGDNWTVLLSQVVLRRLINRLSPGFVPYEERKLAWKAFWSENR
ncbi:MAG TPA: hypothetical protein PKO06_13845, partial [Candidatus Ozemobacteraceae bacterium]|nr:hypothetical protein [Candidatus Ozemobacteraceae bacterium]